MSSGQNLQALPIWMKNRETSCQYMEKRMENFLFLFFVEFKKWFLIKILNIWFHKGLIFFVECNSVKMEEVRTDRGRLAVEYYREGRVSQAQGRRGLWISQLVPETCWTITTQRADHPLTLWNTEKLCCVEFSSTSTF